MKKHFLYWLALGLVVIIGCQKEVSFEIGDTPAHGSLQSDVTGDCLPKTVNGTYVATTALVPTTNNITVAVDVTSTGTYVITTDTINGYYFRATGTFTSLGTTVVTLRGNGTPFASGTDNFIVSYDGSICDIAVDVLPAGAGGPAVFTLVNGGTPANCASAVVNGTYIKDAAVTSSNTVDITVNVTTIGTYTITATGGGVTFSKTSAFLSVGNQSVTLTATGTPTTMGANTVTFASPFASCSFTMDVVAGAVFSIDCSTAIVNGTYQAGTPLTASNTVDITVNVTAAGPYNISTTATNGMVFTASGTFPTAPAAVPITLTGSGTPGTAGTSNIPVPGTTSCTFPVTVIAGATVDWSFKQGTTTYSGTSDPATFQPIAGGFTLFSFFGNSVAGETISITLSDLSGGITSGDTYNTAATTTNSGAFIFNFPAGDIWTADPTTSGTSVIYNTITHNTTTKTITGKFSGTVKNSGGTILTITNGTFTATYP